MSEKTGLSDLKQLSFSSLTGKQLELEAQLRASRNQTEAVRIRSALAEIEKRFDDISPPIPPHYLQPRNDH